MPNNRLLTFHYHRTQKVATGPRISGFSEEAIGCFNRVNSDFYLCGNFYILQYPSQMIFLDFWTDWLKYH